MPVKPTETRGFTRGFTRKMLEPKTSGSARSAFQVSWLRIVASQGGVTCGPPARSAPVGANETAATRLGRESLLSARSGFSSRLHGGLGLRK
jgi:hypothetical protein